MFPKSQAGCFFNEKRACLGKPFFHKRCISNYRVFYVCYVAATPWVTNVTSESKIVSNFRPRRRKLYRIFLAATPWVTNVTSESKIRYLRFISFGVTQVPEALATTIGSSRKSAAEALMSFLETITFLASKVICLEVLPILSISPYASM